MINKPALLQTGTCNLVALKVTKRRPKPAASRQAAA